MSSVEEPIDQQLVEQTKLQIQTLVAEITRLSRQNVSPAQFYAEFLNRVVAAMAALGGAVWTVSEDGRLALQCHINFPEARLQESEENQSRHARLLYKALGQSEGMLVPPRSGSDDDQTGNPTDFLLVLAALKTDLEVTGLLEIFQRADVPPATQRGHLGFVLEMCELAANFLKGHQLRHFSHRQVLWSRLEDFTRAVHTSLEPIATAYTIANEGRRLIECDRVSVAIRKGNHCTIEAVSGQDVFDKRSNTIRLLGKLATAVVATGDPVWYMGDTRDLAPQVEDAVQEYVDEAHSKMIAVLPLKRPKEDEEDDPDEREDPEPPIGALIVEQIEDNRMVPAMAQRIDVVCRHSATAMANAKEHQDLFLMPVWRAIGKSRWLVRARTLPKTIAIASAVVLVLLALAIWPADFNLESKGTLEPVDRRDVFARADGIVREVKVQHGDRVKKGQELVVLYNDDTAAGYTKLLGTLDAARKAARGLEFDRDQSRDARERVRLSGQLAEKRAEIKGLEAQEKLFQSKLSDLVVRSPIDGQVVTWDVEKRLMRRPVQRGNLLLRVAYPEGKWELELHMAENRMGHIAKAEEDFAAKGEKLKVYYILASEPGTTREGTVTEIGRSAEVRGDEGNTVLIRAAINDQELRDAKVSLLPGSTVSGKVYCGRRAIGYVWFHDLVAFVQSRILFRWF